MGVWVMFRNLFFIQGETAGQFIAQYEVRGGQGFIDHMADIGALNWDGALYDDTPAPTETFGRYHIVSNYGLQYIGIDYEGIEHGNA